MLLNFAQQNIVLSKLYKKKKDTDCYYHVFLCLDQGNIVFRFVFFFFKTALNYSHFLQAFTFHIFKQQNM